MPIRPGHCCLYPIDWRELSNLVHFTRAEGRCDHCSRTRGKIVLHLGDGRWWDAERRWWRDGQGSAYGRRVATSSCPSDRRGCGFPART